MLPYVNPLKLQVGALLPTTLIFLSLLVSLGITMATIACLELRMANGFKQNIEEFQYAELGLKIGESQLQQAKLPTCYSPAVLGQQSWLATNYCRLSLNSVDVSYFIEKIEENNSLCIKVDGVSVGLAADIFRVTAWVRRQENNTVILQSIYMRSSANACKEDGLKVRVGRLSWREIE